MRDIDVTYMNTTKSRNYSFPRNNEGKSSLPHFNELFTFLRFYFYRIILFFFFPPPPKKVALENIKNPLNKSHQIKNENFKTNHQKNPPLLPPKKKKRGEKVTKNNVAIQKLIFLSLSKFLSEIKK